MRGAASALAWYNLDVRPFERFFLDTTLLPESRRIYERAVMLRPIPNLYHYTSKSGLIGILSGRTIWATDIRALNDTSELSYAGNVIREALETETATATPPLRDYFDRFSRFGEYFAPRMKLHISSFCERGDSLSQWRAYASSGFAIGFTGATLEELPDCHIVKIEYRPEVQRRLIHETVAVHRPLLERASRDRNEALFMSATKLLTWQLSLYLASFKDPAFDDEREWRAVTGGEASNVRVRNIGNLDQAYIELSVELSLGRGLHLVEIFHSPLLDSASARPELENTLRDLGYDPGLAKSSAIPLRMMTAPS